MNRKTIQKVIDELNKPEPRLDYVKGILETIIEVFPEPEEDIETYIPPLAMSTKTITSSTNAVTTEDEGSIIDAEARAKLANVQALAQESNG